jgi:hypothetical protein
VPEAARQALAAYAGRIRHDVERSVPGERVESWSDPESGRSRRLTYEHGRLAFAFGTTPTGRSARTVWVLYAGRVWMSHTLPLPGKITVANAAAEGAQFNRDEVQRRRATIVGRGAIDGRQTIHLRETVHPPAPSGANLPASAHLPRPPAYRLDTWVDPVTYVTERTQFTVGGHSSVTDEEWLPRTAANVAKTRIVIPRGFKHKVDSGTALTGTDSFAVSARCA